MERLLRGVLRDEIFASVPLHPYQHAYQAGNSVETACHRLVVQVEEALDQQEAALRVSFDMEGGLITPLIITPCVMLLSDMGLITPLYGGLEPPWWAA